MLQKNEIFGISPGSKTVFSYTKFLKGGWK